MRKPKLRTHHSKFFPVERQPPTLYILEEFVSYSDEWLFDATSLRQSKATIAGKVDAIAKLKWFLNRINATNFGPREIQRFVSYVTIEHEDAEGR